MYFEIDSWIILSHFSAEIDFDFSLYMFSLNKPQNIEKQITSIDVQLSKTPAFEYMLRASLKDEKKKLLKMMEQEKGKGKVSYATPA